MGVIGIPVPCFGLKIRGFKKIFCGWWKWRLNEEEEGKYPLCPKPRDLKVLSDANPVQLT